MTLGDLIAVLGARDNTGECPHLDAADDVRDVMYQLCDTGQNTRNPCAGGLALRTVDLGNVVRIGLEEMIKAHRIVEAQRRAAIATTKETAP